MPAPSPRISIASPTGQQWRIGHGRQEVVVCEVGATLRSYPVGPTTVLDGFGSDEWSHSGRGQVLAPWPNRLADGRFEFNGVRAQAALDEPERRNAIHGLVRWMPWTLQTRHQNQLSLRLQLHPSPGYPFSLLLEIDYHVGREGLSVTTRAQSLEEGRDPLRHRLPPLPDRRARDGRRRDPARAGAPHPRDGRPGPPDGRALARGGHRAGLHHGALRRAGGARHRLHHPATATPTAWPGPTLDAPGGVGGAALWVDAGFPYLMVYTGDTLGEVQRRRRGVAIEPMTCPPNALRTGTDVIVLQPGQEWTARWGIEPR